MKRKTIFLTGATGLLGSYLLKILLQDGCKVYALARSAHNKDAPKRVADILRFWDERVLTKNSNNLTVLEGDITKKGLGLNRRIGSLLTKEIDEIFHCAASTKLTLSLKEIRKINIEGTRNVLELGFAWNKKGILRKVNHISTAFICGDYKDVFKEDDLNIGQDFNNPYEQSKFEAEILVRKYIEKGMTIPIFRPSIILGEYSSGKTTDFKMFYQSLYLCSLGIINEVPLNTKAAVNLIPVDLVAQAIYTISSQRDENEVYHITSPINILTTHIIHLASIFFKFSKPKFVSFRRFENIGLRPHIKKMLEIYMPYFNISTLFNSDKTQRILKNLNFKYQPINDKFLYRIFRSCNRAGFIKINKI